MWITEVNLDSVTPARKSGLTVTHDQTQWIEAKAVLRFLIAYVNKGVSAIYFFALTNAGDLSLVAPKFIQTLKTELQLKAGSAAKGQMGNGVRGALSFGSRAAGPAVTAIGRLVRSMRGAQNLGNPRQLRLEAIGDFSGATQFSGNGSPNTPSLYNRDVLAFFPFEVNPRRFVIPVYVMTRDMVQVQQPRLPATAPQRFDLPAERFRLTIGHLPGCGLTLRASDPLYGSSVPIRRVSCHRGTVQVDMPVVDYPRLLTIDVKGS
jgi:hypothetical protein